MKENIKVIASFLYDIFLRHPEESGTTYLRHFIKTMGVTIEAGFVTIVLFIHAIFPKYFEHTGENIIKRMSFSFHIENKKNDLEDTSETSKTSETSETKDE